MRKKLLESIIVINYLYTPHLNRKKLSTNSPWDFDYVFETMDDYWVGQDENFCPEITTLQIFTGTYGAFYREIGVQGFYIYRDLLDMR